MKLEKMNLPEELAKKLNSTERRWLNVEFSSIFFASVAVFLLSICCLYVSDRLWDTSPFVRLVLLVATLGSFIVSLVAYFKQRAQTKKSPFEIIGLIQKHYPQLGDSLQGAVELSDEKARPDNISPELCRAAVKQVANETNDLNFEQAVSISNRNGNLKKMLIGIVVLIAFVMIDNRAVVNTFQRWVNPFSEVSRFTFVQLNDLPKEMIVLHGEAFTVDVSVHETSSMKPDEISYRFEGQKEFVASLSDEKVTLEIVGQTEENFLVISSFDFTQKVKIIPVHRPALTEIQAVVSMPTYLQHEAKIIDLQGNSLDLLEGSSLKIQGQSSNDLKQVELFKLKPSDAAKLAKIEVDDQLAFIEKTLANYKQEKLSLIKKVEEKTFESSLISAADKSQFFVTWLDKYDFKEKEPFKLNVNTFVDEAPQVEFKNVSRAVALLAAETLPLPISASDNYGVRYIHLEYEVQIGKNANYSKTYKHVVITGSPKSKTLDGEFIFAPKQLGIPEGSSVKIRALTNDYLPDRKDIVSAEYKIFVLSKEEHAKLIQERFDSLSSKLEGIGMQEDENLQKNLQLADMDLDDLNSEKGTEGLEEALDAEKANARKMEQLIDEGMGLIEEALKNDEFQEDQLREWTEMMDELNELEENEMSEIQESLAQAGQEESASSGLRLEGLKSAIKKQQEVLRKLRRLSKDFDENMKKATLRNFAARLRSMSKKEKSASKDLQKLFVQSVGMNFEDLPNELKQLNDKVLKVQKEEINKPLTSIRLEIASFYARTKIDKYKLVIDDMEQKNVDEELKELAMLIELNKASAAIKPTQKWAKQINDWAEMLDSKPKEDDKNQDQNESQNQQDNMELLLAIIRIIEEEQDLHNETKFVEWKKEEEKDKEKSKKDHEKATEELSGRQKENREKLVEIHKKLKESKSTELIDGAANAMDEAERLLKRHKSGVNTLAAESAAIELLISLFDANNQGGGSGSSMMSMMMQQMIQQQGRGQGGTQPGGNNSGGQVSDVSDVSGSSKGDQVADKSSEKRTGISLDEVPVEFREALESYFKEVEAEID
ncbi:MAG: hypothetical protein NE334_04845 [Lentisphaeraceae bacterium]|nr:hypothetical protein [Lentisphaeraceae bacterium]